MTRSTWLVVLCACSSAPPTPSPADVPVEAAPAPAVESQAVSENPLQKCIDECVASRQMEAVAIEMIEESCAQGCADEPPLLPIEMPSAPTPEEEGE